MAVRRTKAPRKPQRKPDPKRDRFAAVGGGPADGVLYLPRRRAPKDESGRVVVLSDLPDEVPFPPFGSYAKRYDPESDTHMYEWRAA